MYQVYLAQGLSVLSAILDFAKNVLLIITCIMAISYLKKHKKTE